MRRIPGGFLILLSVIVIAGCDDKVDPIIGPNGDGLPENVTYSEHIQPLLEANCTTCHSSTIQGADRNGAPAGVDFNSYDSIVQWADRANARIQAGTMPPSGGIDSGDRGLFQKWIDQGMNE